MLTFSPLLLDGRHLLCTNTDSAVTCFLCTCSLSLWLCFSTLMYISAPLRAVGTPSEFSSVPILVADELAHFLILCILILGEYPIPNHSKSRPIALQLRLSNMRDDYA
jgi:hypothetical protein